MVTETVRFYWGGKKVRQDNKDVIYWELLQKLPNGVISSLAMVGPLPESCVMAHEAGQHYQSQFTCRVENEIKLESTETLEESMGRLNKYFGLNLK